MLRLYGLDIVSQSSFRVSLTGRGESYGFSVQCQWLAPRRPRGQRRVRCPAQRAAQRATSRRSGSAGLWTGLYAARWRRALGFASADAVGWAMLHLQRAFQSTHERARRSALQSTVSPVCGRTVWWRPSRVLHSLHRASPIKFKLQSRGGGQASPGATIIGILKSRILCCSSW